MDDSNRLKAEFPLGDTLLVIAQEPTSAQQMVLGLMRQPKNDDGLAVVRLIRRLFTVLEELVGSDVWYDVIEQSLLTGEISSEELMVFARDVMSFNWAAYHEPDDVSAIISQEADHAPEPAPRAPRVITGG